MSGRAVLDSKRTAHLEGDDGLTRCGVPFDAYDLHWATVTRLWCSECMRTVVGAPRESEEGQRNE